MGSKEDVAMRIDADTKLKIEEMNKGVSVHKIAVSKLIKKFLFTSNTSAIFYIIKKKKKSK